MKAEQIFGIIVIGATTRRRVDGGSLLRGVYSSVYIDMLSFEKSDGRRTSLMLTVDTLIAVLSLCLTSFGLGYAIGSNGSKTTKNNRPSLETERLF